MEKHHKNYIDNIKRKLELEGINEQDSANAIKCLSKCVAPELCISTYLRYIKQGGNNERKTKRD